MQVDHTQLLGPMVLLTIRRRRQQLRLPHAAVGFDEYGTIEDNPNIQLAINPNGQGFVELLTKELQGIQH